MTFSSAYPIHVCKVCEEQLQIAQHIQKKFLKIDEFWRGKGISFATVILNEPSAEFEIKQEPLECDVENDTDYIPPNVIESNEMESQSNCIELRIEKVKKIKETKVNSKAVDQSPTFFCYKCNRSKFKELFVCCIILINCFFLMKVSLPRVISISTMLILIRKDRSAAITARRSS